MAASIKPYRHAWIAPPAVARFQRSCFVSPLVHRLEAPADKLSHAQAMCQIAFEGHFHLSNNSKRAPLLEGPRCLWCQPQANGCDALMQHDLDLATTWKTHPWQACSRQRSVQLPAACLQSEYVFLNAGVGSWNPFCCNRFHSRKRPAPSASRLQPDSSPTTPRDVLGRS